MNFFWIFFIFSFFYCNFSLLFHWLLVCVCVCVEVGRKAPEVSRVCVRGSPWPGSHTRASYLHTHTPTHIHTHTHTHTRLHTLWWYVVTSEILLHYAVASIVNSRDCYWRWFVYLMRSISIGYHYSIDLSSNNHYSWWLLRI